MRVSINIPVCGVYILIALSCGCASQDKYLKAEGATHVPQSVSKIIPDDADIAALMTIRLVQPNGKITNGGSPDKQALYYSIDMANLMAATKLYFISGTDQELARRRNDILEVLVLVSDLNSETYLSRAFAVDLSLRGIRGGLNRIFTAAQTATSLISAETTAVLGLSNLLIGGLGDEYNSLVYANKTYDALRSAIDAERVRIKSDIKKSTKQPYVQYTIQDALSDIRRLSEASSIRIGVALLLKIADQEKKAAVMQAIADEALAVPVTPIATPAAVPGAAGAPPAAPPPVPAPAATDSGAPKGSSLRTYPSN